MVTVTTSTSTTTTLLHADSPDQTSVKITLTFRSIDRIEPVRFLNTRHYVTSDGKHYLREQVL